MPIILADTAGQQPDTTTLINNFAGLRRIATSFDSIKAFGDIVVECRGMTGSAATNGFSRNELAEVATAAAREMAHTSLFNRNCDMMLQLSDPDVENRARKTARIGWGTIAGAARLAPWLMADEHVCTVLRGAFGTRDRRMFSDDELFLYGGLLKLLDGTRPQAGTVHTARLAGQLLRWSEYIQTKPGMTLDKLLPDDSQPKRLGARARQIGLALRTTVPQNILDELRR